MTPDAEIGQFDLLPAFKRQLLRADGSAPDLTGLTVLFRSRTPGCGSRELETTGAVIDARSGYVSHDWTEPETRRPGTIWLYAVVTGPGYPPESYPTSGFWTVRVLPRIG